MTNTAKLLDEHNELARATGKMPLKVWKQSQEKLKGRISELRKLAGKDHKPATKKIVDKMIEKEAARKVANDNIITVASVAKELGMNPKVARAKLRRAGMKANEGRWAPMKKNGPEHKDLIKLLQSTAE